MSSAFNIPSLIPPLPSSSNGKENAHNSNHTAENHSSLKEKSRKTNSTSGNQETPWRQSIKKRDYTTPPISDRKLQERHSARQPLSSIEKSKGTPLHERSKRAVLRIGEKVESLFCITSKSSEEQVELAQAIASGSKSDDPIAWLKVLDTISYSGYDNSNDLIRVYRRATLRFPLSSGSGVQTNPAVLKIWLAFAALQAKLNLEEEARSTFRYIENQSTNLSVSFFLDFAAFEEKHDLSKAKNILNAAIAKGVEPTKTLQHALGRMTGQEEQMAASEEVEEIETPQRSGRQKRTREELTTSPKRRRLSPHKDSSSRFSTHSVESSSSKDAPRTALRRNSKVPTSTPDTASRETQPAGISKKLGYKRPTRLSGRLSRKGLSGKAKRVEADTSVLEASDSEPETSNPSLDFSRPKKHSPLSPKNTVKIKKMDLGYMMEWDPTAREKTVQMKSGATTENSQEKLTCSTSASGSQHTTTSRRKSTDQTSSSNPETPSQAARSQDKKKDIEQENSNPLRKTAETLQTAEAPAEDVKNDPAINKEFLPLVHENNILRVNETAYAKLGVIGKGGSCKVYRALSKKCTVVAIKKVKLDGMDQGSIDGYANEISLLKRLRGNPAIIQLYDSQVDLARKSIFLVMEVGEADLNHILQQRSIAGNSYSLNMHFIRLTWQQMLSAVHCIHEERIIHSDLKPANFLFVRGALKLIDFGIAKAIQNEDTTNIYRESHIGTLNYMSPEAILDTETDENGPRMKIGRVSSSAS